MIMFPRKQRVILLRLSTLLYICGAAVMISGVWSTTAFDPRRSLAESFDEAPHLVWGDDGTGIPSEIRTAGARSLTSTDDSSESAQLLGAEPQAPEDERDSLQSSLPELYHLPQIFALNYDEMMRDLRVYIYPDNYSQRLTSSKNDSYDVKSSLRDDRPESTTTGFFRLLTKSESHKFRTTDPDVAHLFFLPVSIDALYSALGPDGVGNHLRQYIQDIRVKYTFWDRSLGADHFYLASYGYEAVNHRNNLELTKNAIQVACSPLQPNQAFYPHKDVVLPHYHPAYSPSKSRSTLAYINIDLAQSPLLPQKWKSDSDFVMASSDHQSSAFASSKFCISLSIRNVVDALRHGCVPVVVSDSVTYDLPFQDVLNWREFAVVIGTEEIADVSSVLTSMSAEKYAKMQYLGLQASKHMEWNDPPAAYDAYHMTMFELWMRRHSVRYARRSETS